MTIETTATQNKVPDHVPADLVREFDFKKNMVGIEDSYLEFKKLHNGPSIFYTPCQGGHWVVTRYEDLEFILRNAADFSSANALIPKDARPMHILPLESDPPLHTDYRKILRPFFTAKAVKKLSEEVLACTVELVEELQPKGQCEFMTEFAQKLPIGIFMRLVNLPDSDVPRLLEYAAGFFHGETPEEQMAGTEKMIGYVMEKLQERQTNLGDDLLSAVLTGTVEDGRPLTQMEIIGMATVLLLGGLDTVAATLGWIAKFLAENPEHRRQIVENPELAPCALEEMLRRFHIGSQAREVKHDLVYKGITMKKGDMVLLPLILAGIDEQHFHDPFTVDFERSNTRHLAFGSGPHACIGSMLARVELRTFLTEWLKLIPEFSVKPGAEFEYKCGITHVLSELPLLWDVA